MSEVRVNIMLTGILSLQATAHSELVTERPSLQGRVKPLASFSMRQCTSTQHPISKEVFDFFKLHLQNLTYNQHSMHRNGPLNCKGKGVLKYHTMKMYPVLN